MNVFWCERSSWVLPVKKFMNRNSDLSVKTPETLSAARTAGINREDVDKWFRHCGGLGSPPRPADPQVHLLLW